MTAAAQPVTAGSPDAMEAVRRGVRRKLWILGLLGFLAHGSPHVGVDAGGSGHCFFGIVGDRNLGLRGGGVSPG